MISIGFADSIVTGVKVSEAEELITRVSFGRVPNGTMLGTKAAVVLRNDIL